MATKILLVEDNADNLLVLAICLQIEGFIVGQAHDGSEAFQKLEDETSMWWYPISECQDLAGSTW